MSDNYCFPAFGSTLKIDESLNSINAHLPHQLTTYTDQFLLSLPYPYPYPPHPTPLSSSCSRRLSTLVTWSLSSNQSILMMGLSNTTTTKKDIIVQRRVTGTTDNLKGSMNKVRERRSGLGPR